MKTKVGGRITDDSSNRFVIDNNPSLYYSALPFSREFSETDLFNEAVKSVLVEQFTDKQPIRPPHINGKLDWYAVEIEDYKVEFDEFAIEVE